MAPDGTEGKELRPPSLGRTSNAAVSPEHVCRASRVMSPASSTLRTAAWRVNRPARWVWRHNGFEIGADWQRAFTPSLAMPRSHVGWSRKPGCSARRTRFRCETGQDDPPAQPPQLSASAGSKGGRLRRFLKVELGRATGSSTIGSEPPGCPRDRAYIILAAPDARPGSCGLRLGDECRDRHVGAWRTSLPHCTRSPRCPWPDRK